MGEPIRGTGGDKSSRWGNGAKGDGPDNARPGGTGAPAGGRGKALALALSGDGSEGSPTGGPRGQEKKAEGPGRPSRGEKEGRHWIRRRRSGTRGPRGN